MEIPTLDLNKRKGQGDRGIKLQMISTVYYSLFSLLSEQ